MKKITAIILLSVHLFYIGGYTVLFQFLIHQTDAQMARRIDENKIGTAKLVEIKIPVNLPYIADWPEYQKIEGQVQYNGVFYNYVQLKMSRDTMSLICTPNNATTRLVKAGSTLAKQINDVPLNKKGQSAPLLKKNTYIYDYHHKLEPYQFVRYSYDLKKTIGSPAIKNTPPYIESPGKPPNFLS